MVIIVIESYDADAVVDNIGKHSVSRTITRVRRVEDQQLWIIQRPHTVRTNEPFVVEKARFSDGHDTSQTPYQHTIDRPSEPVLDILI